jgi:Icc-related predicted phosphoesterase
MKILATADLHGNTSWYRWLLRRAPSVDAIIVAGDLLDMFSDPIPQIEALRRWVDAVTRTRTTLLLCAGNHDRESTPLVWPAPVEPDARAFADRARLAERWMDALLEEGATMVGGMTQSLDREPPILVTSLIYGSEHDQFNESLLAEAAASRRQNPSPWLVLHHQPPVGVLGDMHMGSATLRSWIERFRPTAVFTGHDHSSPFRADTACERIGPTRVFNAGHRSQAKRPCAVELDVATMRFSWIR